MVPEAGQVMDMDMDMELKVNLKGNLRKGLAKKIYHTFLLNELIFFALKMV